MNMEARVSTASIRTDAGFSFVEALVALFVFATAAVALVQMQASSILTLSRVEQVALASIVADDVLVDVVAARAPPPAGTETGELQLGGRTWRWARTVEPTADPRTWRVSVVVGLAAEAGREDGDLSLARREAFFDGEAGP